MSKTKALNRETDVEADSSTADMAKKLFDVVRIIDVSMTDCHACLRCDVSDPLLLSIHRVAKGSRSPDRRKACAQIRFRLEGRPEESDKKDADLFIEATFNAIYEVPEDLKTNGDALDFFAQANGTYNLWPYWREFVQTTSARMGLQGLTVPTYRIQEAFSGPGSAD